MKRITITGILLAMVAGACLYEASAQTAVTLTGTSYTNAFDNLTTEGFPPAEWATRTAASATAVGTIYAWNTANSSPTNYWALTSGRFANQASAYSYGSAYSGATNFVGTESRQIQTNEPNRCMALRQTSSVGDPGGAFCFKIAETANRKDFHFYVDLLNLDTAPTRTTVWTVDYGLGDTPSSFVPVATWTNTPLIFTRYATNITFPNGTIDNIA